VVIDKYTLKMTNGSSLLLADEGMIKNDDKKQNQCFSVFLFKVNYAKGSCGSICVCPTIRYLQHVYSEKKFLSGLRL
jgi:hypothetical protein